MDRRSALKKSLTAGAAVGAVTLGTPALSQNKLQWRMVTTWPKNFPGLGVGAENLAKRINDMAGGRLTVKVYSAGEMVPPLQALDAVISGTASMWLMVPGRPSFTVPEGSLRRPRISSSPRAS